MAETLRDVTALVLAGGQGARMGGVDKGLQPFHGRPLVWHALQRLQRQQGGRLAGCLVSANRHLDQYATLGWPVLPDAQAGFDGPLAGLLAGLAHCETRWLLSVPCDAPRFPLDLLQRLAAAAERERAAIALAALVDPAAAAGVGARLRPQPVFCLLQTALRQDLVAFLQAGGRKVGAWAGRLGAVLVPFGPPHDDALAFANANTPAELQALERDLPVADAGYSPADPGAPG